MLTLALLGLLTAHEGEMPEPILVESITDLDTKEAGELELEIGTSTLSTRGTWATRLEAEWRFTGHLGLMLEAGLTTLHNPDPNVRVGASFAAFHDDALGLHAQVLAFATLHGAEDENALLDPAEPATDFALGAHAGWHRNWWTVRAELTAGFGGHVSHLPVRANLALLAGNHLAFFGVESLLDFARFDPWTIAAEAELREEVGELSVRLAIAIPYRPRTDRKEVAVMLRVLVGLDD
ncbi:MAG: hypothetical protein QM723_00860 [Myxococcaceae bacterium]